MEEKAKEILLEKKPTDNNKSLSQSKTVKDQVIKEKLCYANVFLDEKGEYQNKNLLKKENFLNKSYMDVIWLQGTYVCLHRIFKAIYHLDVVRIFQLNSPAYFPFYITITKIKRL